MAKSLRSKYKKRIRNARADHLYKTKGKAQLEKQSKKLQDPCYSMATDHGLPINAFLHPNNPLAVFPQTDKPDIMDFRINKMEKGGLVAFGTFRKMHSKNATQSKYATIVKTNEMLLEEERQKENAETAMEIGTKPSKADMQVGTSSKVTSVDELAAMTASLQLGKKKKAKASGNAAPQIQLKSKGIKKKVTCKKSRKQMGF
jgi:hypothetical protein